LECAFRLPRRLNVAAKTFTAVGFLLLFTALAFAADPIRPDPVLTPGAVLTTDTSIVCRPGYTRTVRHTSGAVKHQVYAEYGIDPHQSQYEIDHLIPLEIGGADTLPNLWPQSYDTKPWNALVKDHLENYLHVEVCAGHIGIEDAQREFATDWIAAYMRHLGEP